MTSLIAWVGRDNHGITSLYMASDSRFSWKNFRKWDYGQKIFCSRNFSILMGYCGDVLFASAFINSLMNLIDNEIIFKVDASIQTKYDGILEYLNEKFRMFPRSDTTVLCSIKDSNNNFHYFEYYSRKSNEDFVVKTIDLTKIEGLIDCYGSGKPYLMERIQSYRRNDIYGKSRFYYMIFNEVLEDKLDRNSGGAPQLKGIYRGGKSKVQEFGTIWNCNRYFNGMKINAQYYIDEMEWRNEKFERYRSDKPELVVGAQKQPWSRGMKKITLEVIL